MSAEAFSMLLSGIAARLEGVPLDDDMAAFLNAEYPADGAEFQELARLCAEGEREGWLMSREAGGIKFGRAIKPGGATGHFSVDVVRMKEVKGPHHLHPEGEIGAVIPIEGAPHFDAFAPGWYVYPPGSDHHPTVSGGDAYVVYLLPEGAIEFTGR
ncbi:DUF4863 family protein [Sinisalibacter aestuarii]|uniref:DUF4863 family protein n=1 Tax=Sinisalibacter aestuarii TaxID=2949426 RepID=A0ABQ5LUU7_9RHOB|nr:DUF4863 family protein [Sinisalibacter aestuarii]GKY88046.1 hypothetical protein STA1M1_19150 [Sinisalibacter aestuarii]